MRLQIGVLREDFLHGIGAIAYICDEVAGVSKSARTSVRDAPRRAAHTVSKAVDHLVHDRKWRELVEGAGGHLLRGADEKKIREKKKG